MESNAKILHHCCLRDQIPPLPVLADYFGDAFLEEDKSNIVFGVYRGLVIRLGVKADLLDNCFLSNRLNELVHAKYKYQPTGYYKQFCDARINLRSHCAIKPIRKTKWLPIYDGDHCPGCNSEMYVTQDLKGDFIDCPKCFMLMCKNCCHDNSDLCKKCHSQ